MYLHWKYFLGKRCLGRPAKNLTGNSFCYWSLTRLVCLEALRHWIVSKLFWRTSLIVFCLPSRVTHQAVFSSNPDLSMSYLVSNDQIHHSLYSLSHKYQGVILAGSGSSLSFAWVFHLSVPSHSVSPSNPCERLNSLVSCCHHQYLYLSARNPPVSLMLESAHLPCDQTQTNGLSSKELKLKRF